MNKVREQRVIRRITQFQLRLSTGIHPSRISLIENGLVEAREDEKKRLARALGLTRQDLFPVEVQNERAT